MKTKIIFTSIFLVSNLIGIGQTWPTTGCGSSSCDICYRNYYNKLVFSDEFDESSLDDNKWKPQWGIMRSSQDTKQFYYGENNIEVSNGTLKIKVNKLTNPITPTYWFDGQFVTNDFYYTSAEIHSLFKFGYGKYEIRCRLPEGAGFFPAFWLYSDNPWDEIDIFDEKFNDQNDIYYWKAACAHHVEPTWSGCSSPHPNPLEPPPPYGLRDIHINNLTDFSQWHKFTLY
ncbi:MAG: family 16 glycosylhydrolase, partial [Bacteroidales bacterium]|nr:family 16 glycosylhydrolase [Bacteroidales bacterium]